MSHWAIAPSSEVRTSFEFRFSSFGSLSVPDEGLKPLLRKLRAHLFGISPGGKRAYLNPEQVIIGMPVSGRDEEYRIPAPFQDPHHRFGILLCPQSRNLDRETAPDFPTRGRRGCGPIRLGFAFRLFRRRRRSRHRRRSSRSRCRFLVAG